MNTGRNTDIEKNGNEYVINAKQLRKLIYLGCFLIYNSQLVHNFLKIGRLSGLNVQDIKGGKMMKVTKKWVAAAAAAALTLTSLPAMPGTTVQAADSVDQTVRLEPWNASTFNDTNGDGLGEFEGWGTSLCWWANRIGYSEQLTSEAARLFFSDEGLDMNIGRYNVGGGDAPHEVAEVAVNENAQFYDLETEGRTPEYAGTSMSVGTNTGMNSVQFSASDADFGFTKGTNVGSFKSIGWINELGAEPGQGDNLHYTVNVEEAGTYTVKLLLTLTGSNERAAAIRVNGTDDYVVDADTVNANTIAKGNNNNLFSVPISGVELKAGENTIDIGGSGDWTLDFVKMAVIKSGEEGVVPEEDEFAHSEHIIRSDGGVPGSCVDVTKMDPDKDESYYINELGFDQADAECGYAWNYDWDADINQINILKAAAAVSGEDFIAEAFSNSPPYFMTVSGCSSGHTDSNQDNLRSDSYTAFAKYMADVIEHWENEGVIDFQSTDPMNEPYTNYWGAYSNKQEGCHFDQGESQSRILVELNKELESRGIDIIISGTDETSIDTQITSYNALSDEAKNVISRIDTHTYSGSNREGLKELAESEGKNLWMSEVDGTYTAGTDAGEMTAALGLAQRMMTDVNGLGASAWILWNAIDMHADGSEYGQRWVNMGSANDYLTIDDLMQAWKPNDNSSYWGLAAADHNNEEIVLTMKYYGYGQLSRYIRPGYTIIGSSRGNVLSAYDPEGDKAVIVAMNTSGEDKTWKFDLSGFETMGSDITAIRTSGSMADGEKWADVTEIDDIVPDIENRAFTATMKANSITTYIVEGVNGIREDAGEETNPAVTEIEVSADQVTGGKVWNNGTTNTPQTVVDGSYETFYDGVDADDGTPGYVMFDLGEAKEIAAFSYAPRNGFSDRMIGGVISGSDNGTDWTPIYTIDSAASQGTDNFVYYRDFNDGEPAAYRYVKIERASECNISEFSVYGLAGSFTEQAAVTATTWDGSEPKLPETVEVTMEDGTVKEVAANWDLGSIDVGWDEMGLYDCYAVTGTSPEANGTLNAYVLCAPDELEYLIDCMTGNTPIIKDSKYDSKVWNAASALDSLLNKDSSDQAKTDENTWGLTTDISGLDTWDYNLGDAGTSSPLYTYGYWAKEGVSITYDLTLPAGKHDVMLGGYDFWSSRNMDVYYSVDGGEKELLCELAVNHDTGSMAQGTITLAEDAVVTISVENGGDGDPVLGWISVNKHTSFTDAEDYLNAALEQVDIPNKDDVRGNITLADQVEVDGETVNVTWETSHPEIVDAESHEVEGYDVMPAGVVTRPAKDTEVTMTATLSYGEETRTKEITLNVKAAPEEISEDDYTDYFFAYFAGEGYSDGEQIYFASSRDGMNWDDLNNNNPVLTSTLGEEGVRDPFIIRSPEGDKFYLIATDLKIYGNNDWNAAQNSGSQSLMVWESTDLVNWSDQRMVEVSAEIGAGCTWAPEATYDPATGEYVVYWASRTPSVDNKQRVYYAKTRDFYTFTEPQLYIEKDQSSIDTTMIENDGTYYRYTKNEGDSTNELGALTKTIFIEKSSSVLGEFTQIPSDSLNSEDNQWVEGPTIFKLNSDDVAEDTWCLLVDDFGGIGYYPLLTTDLESGEFTAPEEGTFKMPSRARHGTPIRVTAEEYARIMEAYGSPEEVDTVTVMGETPDLPDTVTINTGTEEVQKAVTWNLDGVSFEGNPFSYVTVTGTVEGTTAEAIANVQIIPANIEYMIDCNNLDSETWKRIAEAGGGLLNTEAADQAKMDDNAWGYTSIVGSDDSADMTGYSQSSASNPYTGGWWARGGKNISYQVTLPAGEHTIMLGCTGWWSMGRQMDVFYSVNGGAETKLCDFDAVNGQPRYASGTITLDEEAVVTLTVKKADGNDPILSWIAVSGIAEGSEISLDELQNAVNEANALNAEDYTSGSYQAVSEALDAASAELLNPTSQAEVDAAADALNAAVAALVDISDLRAAVEKYADLTSDAYTEESYAAFEKAYAAAEEVLANADATKDEVENAAANLEAAVEGLQEKPETVVSKDALQALYDEVKDKSEDDYTAESWKAFADVLKAAKAVLEDKDAVQAEVDAAYGALKTAADALQARPSDPGQPGADKDQLQNLYDSNKDIEQGSYTDASYQAYKDALKAAQAVLNDPDATQEEVSRAYSELLDAVKGLTDGKAPQKDPSGDTQGQDPDKDAAKNEGAVQTGDTTPAAAVAVIAAAAVLAAIAAITVIIIRRRRNR